MDRVQSVSSQDKYRSMYSVSPTTHVQRKKFNKNHLKFGFEYETLPLIDKKIMDIFDAYEKTEFETSHLYGVDRSNYEDEMPKIYWNSLSIQLNKKYAAYNKVPISSFKKSTLPFYMPYVGIDINLHKQWHIEYDPTVGGIPTYKSFMGKYVYKNEYFDTRSFANRVCRRYLEIISPIMKYSYITKDKFSHMMTHILPIDGYINYWNNENTSTHVHVSFPELESKETRPLVMVKIFYAWLYFEPIFLLLCGHWRRKNTYCQNYRGRFNKLNSYDVFTCALDDTNYMDFMPKYFPFVYEKLMHYKKTGTSDEYIAEEIIALLTVMQGGSEEIDRYVSLNLLNLLPNGIGTVEFRIKQGSANVEENKMFMLLLAEFITSVMDLKNAQKQPTIMSTIYKGNPLQYDMWNIYKIVTKPKYDWLNNTHIEFSSTISPTRIVQDLAYTPDPDIRHQMKTKFEQPIPTTHKSDKQTVHDVFEEFFTYIKDPVVKSYWQRVSDRLYNFQMAPPIDDRVVVQMEGGRDPVSVPLSADTMLSGLDGLPGLTRKSKTHIGEVAHTSISMAQYTAAKKKLENIKSRHMRQKKMPYTSSFGVVDYDLLNKTVETSYKKYYSAYLKDTQVKPKPKSI